MAKYIDADKTLQNLPDDLPYKASVKRVLIQAPEEDVVESNEKHIPKKLKVEVVTGRNVRSLYYYCPSCNGFRMETTKHCSNCGQALDWKETFLEYGLEKAYKNWEKLVEESEVVKVVRCKDCKHRRIPTRCSLWYGSSGNDDYFCEYGDDFYCAFGERKDGENDEDLR